MDKEKNEKGVLGDVEGSRSGESLGVGYEQGLKETALRKGADGVKARITEEQAKILLAEAARETQEGLKTNQKGKRMVIAVVVVGVAICLGAVALVFFAN